MSSSRTLFFRDEFYQYVNSKEKDEEKFHMKMSKEATDEVQYGYVVERGRVWEQEFYLATLRISVSSFYKLDV